MQSGSNYSLTTSTNISYNFTLNGLGTGYIMSSITDATGQVTTLTYATDNYKNIYPTKVTDPSGTRYLTINYTEYTVEKIMTTVTNQNPNVGSNGVPVRGATTNGSTTTTTYVYTPLI